VPSPWFDLGVVEGARGFEEYAKDCGPGCGRQIAVALLENLGLRARNKWRRLLVGQYGRRDFALQTNVPYISFTFDDFPRSAFLEGGRILAAAGARGTYFVSMQLLDSQSRSGPIASRDDVKALLRDGHELGCHTFEHLDGRHATVAAFERSVVANGAALDGIVPGARFPVFAYPLDGPVLGIKRAVGAHFVGCRGGGQTFNSGIIDLNLLNAYFLDWRNRGDLGAVRDVIERNAAARGWLIFATHDVAADPSMYGCDSEFFENVVRLAVQSRACVVPMMRACEELHIAP
jgi:peptidoglycan/xylan/chitin deacetylase (PgdA/CDA1 family)